MVCAGFLIDFSPSELEKKIKIFPIFAKSVYKDHDRKICKSTLKNISTIKMKLKIGNKLLKEKNKAYIIAEIGVNLNGKLQIAKKLIDQALLSGADCVKFQTFNAENVCN